jgi:hypothetical protein
MQGRYHSTDIMTRAIHIKSATKVWYNTISSQHQIATHPMASTTHHVFQTIADDCCLRGIQGAQQFSRGGSVRRLQRCGTLFSWVVCLQSVDFCGLRDSAENHKLYSHFSRSGKGEEGHGGINESQA